MHTAVLCRDGTGLITHIEPDGTEQFHGELPGICSVLVNLVLTSTPCSLQLPIGVHGWITKYHDLRDQMSLTSVPGLFAKDSLCM